MIKALFRHSLQVLIIVAISYGLCELIYSTLYVNGWVVPVEPFWISEESGKTVHFDPILGYRLTPTPSRVAKISHSSVEFRAVLKGNAQGFTDSDDFTVQAVDSKVRRIAVLGDSFTAAQYLEQDWTQRIEAYAKNTDRPIEMLNFAIAGVGLANWWSVLIKHIKAENYALDGIIFAVFEGNLHRGFSVMDHRNQRQHPFGRIPSWEPEQWPQTLQQAQPYMQLSRGFILSPQEFEQATTGAWLPPDPKPAWQPYASLQLARLFEQTFANNQNSRVTMPQIPDLTPPQIKLIEEIAAYIHAKNWPVMVASIPSRPSLLADAPTPADVKQFATLLNARFVDGNHAFAGLSEQQIRAHWLPVDGHWGQLGSDAFAQLIWQALQDGIL